MSKLVKEMEKDHNRDAHTLNDARSYHSTLDACVDFFGKAGALRNNSEDQIISYFTKAFSEDPSKALKILFWVRDIRGGAGERRTFRIITRYIAENYPGTLSKNLYLFPEYGRWDDLFHLIDTPVWDKAWGLIESTHDSDLDKVENGMDDSISLLWKWLPSENTSSPKTRQLAKRFIKAFGISESQYRRQLSFMREKLRIVERKMCANEWGDITYEHVPSRASMIYRNAFRKHDNDRYQEYLDDVTSGKKEIKTGTLYPYDIAEKVFKGENNKTLNLQWDNLPNYMEGREFNGLVIADTSGSMFGRPICISVSLALYIAEKNKGAFHNYFMTFSAKPQLQKIQGNTVYEKIRNLNDAHWDMNTDLRAAFETILDTAVKQNVPAEEMPEKLIIVSDMQFDRCCHSNKRTNLEQIDKMYHKAGYKRPSIVFWNVNSYSDVPMTIDDRGVCLVSGSSPSILKSVLSGNIITPVDVMNQTIESERYQPVKV